MLRAPAQSSAPILPSNSVGTEYYWSSGADGRLRILQCGACGYYIHPPSPVCPRCLSFDVAPQPVSGRGKVYSFTINQHRWFEEFDLPYCVAMVHLDEQEGLRVISNIIDCEPEEVRIGLPVQVVLQPVGEYFIPLFAPIEGDAE
jgi:uncharacterized OB-fold protein